MPNRFLVFLAVVVTGCATETYDPLLDYEELSPVTVLDAPPGTAVSGAAADAINRGEYLVELLGCGACHTDGALIGEPDFSRSLAGSRVGVAYTNPLEYRNPGVVFPSNLTPHPATGIGALSDEAVAAAIRSGAGRHGGRKIVVMPWQGYSRLTDGDVAAIVSYLRSLEPVEHRVPDPVAPGSKTGERFVYFGVYQRR